MSTIRDSSHVTALSHLNDLAHLNDVYAVSEDPWHLRSGWYDDRKADVVLAALPRARFARTCTIGLESVEFTTRLARRSESVFAIDNRREVAEVARNRTGHLSNVTVCRLNLPDEWPASADFDLIVLNEIGYYFGAAEWAQLSSAVASGLGGDGTVLACHWRHERPGRTLETETLHGLLDSTFGLTKQTQILDADFMVDVWTRSSRSVAATEGLI